jgi:hypothetical protein
MAGDMMQSRIFAQWMWSDACEMFARTERLHRKFFLPVNVAARLPARNRKDLEDIPDEARRQLEFIWLERVDEAVSSAIESGAPASEPPSKRPARRLAEAKA